MQVIAKLLQKLPLQTGQGKNGTWQKQDIIVETDGQYPKKICLSLWGDKFSNITLTEQQTYKFDIDLESREFSGRWFTDVKAWRIEAFDASTHPQTTNNTNNLGNLPPLSGFDQTNDDDGDLPF
jgi:hypothetical protein